MKTKEKLLSFKSLLFCTLAIFIGLSVGACSKDKPDVPPSPGPGEDVPATIAACVPGDIEALRAIAKANPEAHLFEGDKPEAWKGMSVKWLKDANGKYAVGGLSVKEDSEIKNLVLNIGGGKDANIVFSRLQSIDITSASAKEITVLDQPALRSVRVNGAGKAEVEKITIMGGTALKEISIEGMPDVKEVLLGGNSIDRVTLADLPGLQEQSKLQFRAEDKDKNVEGTAIKEIVLKGDMKSLNGLYLAGLGLEKFTLQTSLPEVTSLTLNNNKLSGSFELKGLEKLKILYLRNNSLTGVNISECPALTDFDASSNKELSQCTLSLPALKILDLNETAVSTLDVSALTALQKASAYNSNLSSFKLSGQNTKLTTINLADNKLSELDFPKEASAIFLITLDNNAIKSLDLSSMPSLERVMANNNKLETLNVPEKADDFERLECKNNHLTVKQLKEIKNRLTELSEWEIAPQYLLSRTDAQKKQIDASEEVKELQLSPKVQKYNAGGWADAPADEFVQQEGVYTFSGKGQFRVICTSFLDFSDWKFDIFDVTNPYVIGELEL